MDDQVVSDGSAGSEPVGRRLQHRRNFEARGPWAGDRAGDVGSPIDWRDASCYATNVLSLPGQVTAVEGGAYVLQDVSGVEHRIAHDENTRIDRPAHVGDRIEAFVDGKGRAVFIRNIDQDGRVR